MTVSLKDAENYVWSDNTDAAKTFDFVIAKAPVTVTVKDKSVYTYDAAPDLSKPEPDKDYTVSGLIGEDKLTTAPMLKYAAAPDMNKTGEAAKITASGASAGENYEITYVDGKLTVTSRSVLRRWRFQQLRRWRRLQQFRQALCQHRQDGNHHKSRWLRYQDGNKV